jgi:hypothetical protein
MPYDNILWTLQNGFTFKSARGQCNAVKLMQRVQYAFTPWNFILMVLIDYLLEIVHNLCICTTPVSFILDCWTLKYPVACKDIR